MTPSAEQALGILRDGSHFEWYVIPLLALVLYAYALEVERRNWSQVLAGLALWGMDWCAEIVNALVLHATGRAPLWGAPGGTAYLVLVGLNIEICFMFALAGLVFVKMLPRDPSMRLWGVQNRWFLACSWSAFCVMVELLLNRIGALTWDWPWWSASFPLPIFLFGYLQFFVVAFVVHDMRSRRAQVSVVASILGIAALGLIVFGSLGWI